MVPLDPAPPCDAAAVQRLRATGDARERMDPWVAARFRAGARVGEAAYRAALAAREPSRRDFVDALGDYDLLLTPTTPIPALPIDQVDEASLPLSRFTRAFSYLDPPALTVPRGFTPAGLPIGLQIVALDGREDSAIALGAAFQRRTDWHEFRPALSLDRLR